MRGRAAIAVGATGALAALIAALLLGQKTAEKPPEDRENRMCRGGCTGGPSGAPFHLLPTVSSAQQASGVLTAPSGLPVTVSRASNKSCHNSSGAIVTLLNDTACVESKGLLVEAASTNYFLNSGSPATQTFTLSTGAWTASMDSGTGSIAYAAGTATATGLPCTVNVSTVCYFTVTAGGSATATVTGTAVAPQLESQAWASSYISSAGSPSSRAPDVISTPNTMAGVSSAKFCVGYTGQPEPHSWDGRNVVIISSGLNGHANTWYLRNSAAQLQPFIYDQSGGFSLHSGAGVDDASHRIVFCNIAGVETERIDGSLVSLSDFGGGGTAVMSSQPATMEIGSVAGVTQLNGWLRNICVGPDLAECT